METSNIRCKISTGTLENGNFLCRSSGMRTDSTGKQSRFTSEERKLSLAEWEGI